MSGNPDFEALRAERNARHDAFVEKMHAQGWEIVLQREYNRDACYCACKSGGPCEHKFDGDPYESKDGSLWSATCSRCGMMAFSHDIRNAL